MVINSYKIYILGTIKQKNDHQKRTHPSSPHGTVIELRDARKFTEQELYMESLRHDPTISDAYFRLGVMLESGQTISLFGATRTGKDLYVLSLAKDPKKAPAYFNLAGILLEDNNRNKTISLKKLQFLYLKLN